jgi:hypothetical protein
MRPANRVRLLVSVTAVLAVIAVAALSASAGARRATAGSASKFGASLTYKETNRGRQQGAATIGIQGTGSFSAKLGARAALEAAVISLVTGVPATKIAQGGTYTVQRDIAASGDVSGLAVARFKAKGLGTVCVSYTEKAGKFVPSTGTARPMSAACKRVAALH